MKLTVTIALLLIACVEPEPIVFHVHEGCTPEEIDLWYAAVDRVNDALEADAARIEGVAPYGDHFWLVCSTNVADDDLGTSNNFDRVTVRVENLKNYASADDYQFLFFSVALHELGHAVAGAHHVRGRGNVMDDQGSRPNRSGYTAEDLIELRRAYAE